LTIGLAFVLASQRSNSRGGHISRRPFRAALPLGAISGSPMVAGGPPAARG
jgi:hypothetical protein